MSVNVVIKSIFDDKGIKNAERAFGGLGDGLKKTAGLFAATLGGAAVANFGKNAILSASNLNAELEGVRQTFGSSAGAVEAFADKASTLVGVSESAALQAAKNFGGFANAANLSGAAAANFSIDLVKAAGDLASFADVPVEEALAAIQSGLSGQSEPLRKFQIFVDDTTLKAFAMEKGLGNVYDTMTQGEKTILRQEAILAQMGVKQNDFVNYQSTFGNSLKTVQAQFEEMQAAIGTALLPAMETLLATVKGLIPVFEQELLAAVNAVDWESLAESVGKFFMFIVDNIDELFGFIKLLLDYAPAILAVVGAYAALTTALEVAKVAQLLFNIATSSNPYVFGAALIITAITGIAGIVTALGNAFGATTDATNDSTTSVNNLNNADLSKLDGRLYQLQLQAQNTAKALSTAASIIPASPTSSTNNRPINPKPGTKYTYYTLGGPNGQAVWFETTWTGTEWTTPKKITYTDPASKKPAEKETTEDRFAAVQKVIKKAQAEIVKAEEAYARTKFEINENYHKENLRLETDAAKRQQDLVIQSQARITDAFKSATQTNLADLFDSTTTRELETTVKQLTSRLTVTVTKETEKTAFASVETLVAGLRDRLNASKQLLENASQLASQGFSQTFIEQVISAGTETGNALADAILNASPETSAELKSLYAELESVSESGADQLAKNLYDTYKLATADLTKQSKEIADELKASLDAQNKALAKSLADAGYAFGLSIKDIKDTFLSDLEQFDGWFAGLNSTIDQLLAKMGQLSKQGLTDTQMALTSATSGTQLAGASITEKVSIKQIQNAQGLVVDSLEDVAGTAAYLQARIDNANKYIKSSSSNAAQEISAANTIANWTKELTNLQGAAASGTAAGTVVNINVKTDTTQSQAMVGKTIGNIVTKYVTTGGTVLVSGNA